MRLEVISLAITGISLVISILALFLAKKSNNDAKLANENAKIATNKANQISEDNLKLQSGVVELSLSQAIENAKGRVVDITNLMTPLVSKSEANTITKEEEYTLETYKKSFNATVETLMNVYDEACSKYIDGKVDRLRFKKTYKYEIRNLLENEELSEYFKPLTSRYKSILAVWDEWDNAD